MFLQRLFVLCALCPASLASVSPSTTTAPARSHQTILIRGGRTFAAELLPARGRASDTRYPGAIIIATDETRDRAFLIASRMAEIGITVIMYAQDGDATHQMRVHDARAAVDSMRRRYDVRPEEVGVIAFEEATTVVPDLARDTTLDFAIAASSVEATRDLLARYTHARAATLLVRGIKSLSDSAAVARALGLDAASSSDTAKGDSVRVAPRPSAAPGPNVTVWPVPEDQLAAIGEAHSPLGLRVVSWVREQVHIGIAPSQLQASAAMP